MTRTLVIAALMAAAAQAAPQPATSGLSPELMNRLGLEAAPPSTPEAVAAARKEADAIAAASQASDLFENVTTTASPALRHRASNLVCNFTSGSAINKVMLFHPPRGDSIGCNTSRGPRSYSIFLDRAPPGRPAADQLIGLLAASIVRRFPDAKPDNPIMVATQKNDAGVDLPPHRVAQYVRSSPRGPVRERLSVGYAGDWVLQLRVTEPADSNDLMNEMSFLSMQKAVMGPARPAASGAPTPP